MMRRRSKRRVIKWMLWVFGILSSIILALALIKIDDIVMAQGIVEPGQKIYIDSPMSRVIHDILVEPGDTVRANQPLVRLYDGDLKAAVTASEKEIEREAANLEAAQARLALLREKPTKEEIKIAESRVEQARITLTARQQELKRTELGERLFSQEDLERAKTNYELAQANLKVAIENLNVVRIGPSPAEIQHAEAAVRQTEAALEKAKQLFEAAREDLARATMRSPVDGVVARQDLYPGMQANQGAIVLIVAGAAEGKVIDAWMPEMSAWKVRIGQPVEILSNLFTDREGFEGLGKVSRIYDYAIHEGGTRTFGLEVAIVKTPIPLSYGSTADLRIIVGRRSILRTIFGWETHETVEAGRAGSALQEKAPARVRPDSMSAKSPPDTSKN